MRKLVIVVVIVAILAAAGAAAYQPVLNYWQQQNAPKWRTAEVSEGTIVSVVNSTGTIKPVLQVSVGSFVSGPIDANYRMKDAKGEDLLDKDGRPLPMAEFNQEVTEGEVLAKIDPRIFEANVAVAEANRANRVADMKRVDAQLQQARRDENRAYALQKLGAKYEAERRAAGNGGSQASTLQEGDRNFIAQAEIDRFHFTRLSLEAQLEVAKTAIDQAQAQLDLAITNLNYTEIRSPVDGIVINRKIEPGQTLAAQFQTPELFIVAPDMRKKMHVHASVDEADIGLINSAKLKKMPVTFTVDAYPDDLFVGAIEEIRLSSTTTQNVVTYPVVVAAPNPDLKLLPGMTASISFEVERRENVLRIPNSALRFFPQLPHVQEKDKPLVEGKQVDDEVNQPQETSLSAEERATARRKRTRRHVWVQDGFKLRAIEVQTGIADGQYTELVSGDLKKGEKLVIGIQAPTSPWGG